MDFPIIFGTFTGLSIIVGLPAWLASANRVGSAAASVNNVGPTAVSSMVCCWCSSPSIHATNELFIKNSVCWATIIWTINFKANGHHGADELFIIITVVGVKKEKKKKKKKEICVNIFFIGAKRKSMRRKCLWMCRNAFNFRNVHKYVVSWCVE